MSDYGQFTTETAEGLRALDEIERLLRNAERDTRLLAGRDHKARRFAEAYRLLDILRNRLRETDA